MTDHDSRIQRKTNASDRAGFVRIAFAVAAVLFADSVCPGQLSVLALSLGYLAVALGFQLAIRRGYAQGQLRSLAMGAVDIAFVSYPVFMLGPATSVLPFSYLLIPVVNAAASSSRSRVAMLLAILGSLVYALLLVLTTTGIAPYAPGLPELRYRVPQTAEIVASGTLVLMSVLLTTHIVLRQMNALDRMNRQLSDLSEHDDLTGLYNRRCLFTQLRHQLERVARGASCGVLMIDLDGFKHVNDRLGHDAGDLLLRDIAAALTHEVRAIDLVARYGGDEFVVVLPDVTREGMVLVAERVVTAVYEVGRARWASTPVTASVGLAFAQVEDDTTALLRRADTQAYAAKRAGGNRCALSEAELTTAAAGEPSNARAL